MAPENWNLLMAPENWNLLMAPENWNLLMAPENWNLLMAPENWQALDYIEALAFMKTFASFSECLWYPLLSLSQETQDLSCNFSQLLIQRHTFLFHSLSDEFE